MHILPMGYFLIPLVLIICFQKLGTAAYALAFTASLTTLAVLLVGDNFIPLYLLLFAVVFVKYISYQAGKGALRLRGVLPLPLLMYVFWCVLSMVQSAFPVNHEVLATGLDAVDYIRFRPSQFTQLIYLLISVVFCWIMTDLLESGIIRAEKLWKVMCAAYIAAVILVYVHALIPKEISLLLFRNGKVDELNSYSTVCGAFIEPSTMACYMSPFVCVFLQKFLRSAKVKYLALAVMGLIAFFLSGSSSAWFGVVFWIVFSLIRGLVRSLHKRSYQNSRRRFLAVAIILVAAIIFFAVSWPALSAEFAKIGEKFDSLSQPDAQGNIRGPIFWLNWKAFLHSPLTGLGFGSVRSAELTTTMLANSGVIGMALYLTSWIPSCVRLSRDRDNDSLVTYVVIYNAIMFIAVPEPYYLTIWAMYALMYAKSGVHLEKGKAAAKIMPLRKDSYAKSL